MVLRPRHGHTRRPPVEQHATRFLFENGDELINALALFCVHRRRQASRKHGERREQGVIVILDDDHGGAKAFVEHLASPWRHVGSPNSEDQRPDLLVLAQRLEVAADERDSCLLCERVSTRAKTLRDARHEHRVRRHGARRSGHVARETRPRRHEDNSWLGAELPDAEGE